MQSEQEVQDDPVTVEAKRWKPIGRNELHQAIMAAGYHCTDGPNGRVYTGSAAWCLAEFDEAADRLVAWLLERASLTTPE